MEHAMQGAPASMLFILTTTLFDSMSLGLANPVLPRLLQALTGPSPSETGHLFGLLLGANSTMLFLAAPVIGRISDRVGRRPVIIIALVGVAVNSLVAATANSLPLFFLAQMIAGICGASMSAAAAYLADVSPREQRVQNFGLLSAVFGAGFVIGPSVGGLLASSIPAFPSSPQPLWPGSTSFTAFLCCPKACRPNGGGRFCPTACCRFPR
jgi:MFS transporter, DHA1 family, tetracycline resistance protein